MGGFTVEVAKCWATERMSMLPTCSTQCSPYDTVGKFNLKCQRCLAGLRMKKRECQFAAMGLSPQCRTCQVEAFKNWDVYCMMHCVDIYTPQGVQYRPICEKCSLDLDSKLKMCGAI